MAESENPEIPEEKVCSTCLYDNLLSDIGIRTCAHCSEPFCLHHASTFDAVYYCSQCCTDLAITRSVITKTSEVLLADEEKPRSITRKAVKTILSGAAWLFEQRRISAMSDAELAISITYHQQDLNLLLSERSRRQIEEAHKRANGIRIAVPSSTNGAKKVTVTEKTTSTKTTVKAAVSPEKKMEQAQALIDQMISKGISQEQLLKILGGS
jgi:hypothetical protein